MQHLPQMNAICTNTHGRTLHAPTTADARFMHRRSHMHATSTNVHRCMPHAPTSTPARYMHQRPHMHATCTTRYKCTLHAPTPTNAHCMHQRPPMHATCNNRCTCTLHAPRPIVIVIVITTYHAVYWCYRASRADTWFLPRSISWVPGLLELAHSMTEDPEDRGYRLTRLWGQWQLQSVSISNGDGRWPVCSPGVKRQGTATQQHSNKQKARAFPMGATTIPP